MSDSSHRRSWTGSAFAGVVVALVLSGSPATPPRSGGPAQIPLEGIVFRLVNAPRVVELVGRFLVALYRTAEPPPTSTGAR
ncbi:hypothetical protein [Allokutzneria oryzae]|uniref:Uncharacterized protein n=1 Tax=Allokutzneria oryzae TaxID=1378989 RepID=A0ABV5ZW04_9PSEU